MDADNAGRRTFGDSVLTGSHSFGYTVCENIIVPTVRTKPLAADSPKRLPALANPARGLAFNTCEAGAL